MNAVLLAALAVSSVPVYLYPQSALPDAAWPTHATIVLPQGWLARESEAYLTENGRPMLAQVEVASRWPDGSPKWLHAFGTFHYQGGQPARYELVRATERPAKLPDSPLSVRDGPDGVHVDTGAVRFFVPRPFVGIARLEHGGQTLIDGSGGPYVIDGEGTRWHTQHDAQAEIIVEQQGPAQVTIKASGWYQTPTPREDAFCRFTTRITAFAGSPLLKVDHATTFADDMKKHAVAELGFKFALPGATGFASATHRGTFRENLQAAYLAQLTDDRLYRIAQVGPDAEKDIRHQGDFERSVGWFSTAVGRGHLALVTKDFWQKYPKEVKFSPDELVYYAWPKHGDLAPDDPTATQLHNVYKFKCFHTGKLLDSHLPEDYFLVLNNQSDTTECRAEFAQNGNLHGASMRNQFALLPLEASTNEQHDAYLEKFSELYRLSPTARVSPQAMAASGALGKVQAAGTQYPEIEKLVVDGILGYARSIPRYNDYGWAIYGNLHHFEIMDYAVNGHRVGRPSLHRVWANSHYHHITTAWQAWALNGDQRLLELARVMTDNYASLGQIRYDKQFMQGDPNDPDLRPSLKYHWPGGFYHCKALLPWGSRGWGERSDIDANLVGHFPDPAALLDAWLYDADRWAKDGYDLWRKYVKFYRGGTRRERNTTLVQALRLYKYDQDAESLDSIERMLFGSKPGERKVGGLLSVPLIAQEPGPLWNPTWLSQAYELMPDNEELKKFIVTSADQAGLSMVGETTLALAATAWEITKDPKYLTQHAGTLAERRDSLFQDPTGRWQDFGFGPGPLGDGYFCLQWYRFSRALHDAKITLPDPPPELGIYFCPQARFNQPSDAAERGGRILFLQREPNTPKELTVDFGRILPGDLRAVSLSLVNGNGNVQWTEPEVKFGPRRLRSSGRISFHSTFPAANEAGLNMLMFASSCIGLFQGIAGGLPECQVLRAYARNRQPIVYSCSRTRGWLVSLSDAPVVLRMRATSRGPRIVVTPRGGQPAERWLVMGDLVDVTLQPGAGPWQLEIGGVGGAIVQMEIQSNNDPPLLYGANLEHVEQIRQLLSAPNPAVSTTQP